MPYYTMPDGESLFVREIGQGEPVLVLSGLGMHSWQWLPFLFPNFKNYKFIIPDWRGFAGSKDCKIPSDLAAIPSHWRDVAHLIELMQLDQFILIGYSMGASTAMHGMQHANLSQQIKAYLHIDQTPKIASDETWPFGLFGQQYHEFKTLLSALSAFLAEHQDATYIYELASTERQRLVELWLDFIRLQNSNKLTPWLFKLALKRPELQKHLLPLQRLDYLAWYINNYLSHNEDYRHAIGQLSCPTTFFIGAQSSLYAAQGQQQIAESLNNARTVLFKQSGHTPLITEPVKFSREIQDFLKQAS